MSYEATVTAARGDEATMAKSIVIIAGGIAKSWYASLRLGSIESRINLRDKLCSNFKGINIEPNHQRVLFTCIRNEREPLEDYSCRGSSS